MQSLTHQCCLVLDPRALLLHLLQHLSEDSSFQTVVSWKGQRPKETTAGASPLSVVMYLMRMPFSSTCFVRPTLSRAAHARPVSATFQPPCLLAQVPALSSHSCLSNTSTLYPCRAKSRAKKAPAGPAPATTAVSLGQPSGVKLLPRFSPLCWLVPFDTRVEALGRSVRIVWLLARLDLVAEECTSMLLGGAGPVGWTLDGLTLDITVLLGLTLTVAGPPLLRRPSLPLISAGVSLDMARIWWRLVAD
jgi:hypothetical protein